MRHTTILFVLIAGVLSLGLFVLKYEVQDLEHEIQSLNRRIVESREAIHVLDAEWSYLNDPARLRKLAAQYTGLRQVMPGELGAIPSLPFKREAPATGSQLPSNDPAAMPRVAINPPTGAWTSESRIAR